MWAVEMFPISHTDRSEDEEEADEGTGRRETDLDPLMRGDPSRECSAAWGISLWCARARGGGGTYRPNRANRTAICSVSARGGGREEVTYGRSHGPCECLPIGRLTSALNS